MSTPRLTWVQWLICAIAAIGFAFDIYELLMLPLVVRPALMELAGLKPGMPEFNQWTGLLFWIPAIAGGLFGLLGGYLTDRFGRRRVLVWSILLYAFSAAAAGFSTSIEMLLFLRTTTFIGVCVEFVAAVAWLAELFPDSRQREAVLGYTQAFSSIGGLLVTGAYALSVAWAQSLPAIHGAHEPWRYTLISGVIPALPLILIRPFLPESPVWARKKAEGSLKRPSLGELFSPQFRKTTLVTTALFACGYGIAFGAIQSVPRIVPGLEELKTLVRPLQEKAVTDTQFYQEFGGLAGRFVLAFLAVRLVTRRGLLRIFQIPALAAIPVTFFYAPAAGLSALQTGIFLVGLLTVAQFSFWGNYLPRVYPTYLRGTGESFAANIGGRMLGTSAAYITATLATSAPGATPSAKLAWASGVVGTILAVAAVILSKWLVEPPKDLPE